MAGGRGGEVSGITVAFFALGTVATVLRIYCRGWVMKAFAADDWLAAIAGILFTVFSTYELRAVHFGNGQHNRDIPPDIVPVAMQMWWTCEPLYVLTNMAIKASIAIFLLRLCVHKTHKVIIWVVITLNEVYSLAFTLLFILQCRPTSLFWLRFSDHPPSGSCVAGTVISNAFYGFSAVCCLTDWTFSLLPILIVWKLQMSTRVKISVIALLTAGVLASCATIVRFPYLKGLSSADDFLFTTTDAAIWSTIELGLSITTAAVATLRPLLKRFFGPGSSAQTYGSSARKWHKTGSAAKDPEPFELADNAGKHTGVVTIVDYSKNPKDIDVERQRYKGDNNSEASESITRMDNWASSQSNLAERYEERRE